MTLNLLTGGERSSGQKEQTALPQCESGAARSPCSGIRQEPTNSGSTSRGRKVTSFSHLRGECEWFNVAGLDLAVIDILPIFKLNFETKEDLLLRIFGTCGPVMRVSSVRTSVLGQCVGYGFSTIDFKIPTPLDMIMKLKGTLLHGREIAVSYELVCQKSALTF